MAQAAVTINFAESGGDVVATSSGSLITAGLSNPATLTTSQGFVQWTGPVPGVMNCAVLVGTDPIEADAFVFTDWANANTDACSTAGTIPATSGTGNFVGVFSRTGASDGIYIPNNYVSGAPISGSSTWAGETFASLGLVPGSYTFTFGAGATADSITLNIGPTAAPSATPVPTLSQWALIGLAVLLSLAAAQKRQRFFG